MEGQRRGLEVHDLELVEVAAGASFYEATLKATGAMPDALARAVKAAAMLTKTTIMAQPGYPARPLRGTARSNGKGPYKASVGFDIKGTQNPTALVKARGPFPLVEGNTKPHEIKRKKRRGKKHSQALWLPGGWVTGPLHHPGTRGRFPFRSGVEASRPLVQATFQRELNMTLAKNLTGVFR